MCTRLINILSEKEHSVLSENVSIESLVWWGPANRYLRRKSRTWRNSRWRSAFCNSWTIPMFSSSMSTSKMTNICISLPNCAKVESFLIAFRKQSSSQRNKQPRYSYRFLDPLIIAIKMVSHTEISSLRTSSLRRRMKTLTLKSSILGCRNLLKEIQR